MDDHNEVAHADATGLRLSRIESVAWFLGILKVCDSLEAATFVGEESDASAWNVLKRRLLSITESLKLDAFLSAFAPDEDLFKQPLTLRVDSDPQSFGETYQRLVDIRKERGVFIQPIRAAASIDVSETGTHPEITVHFSALENLSRIIGMFRGLSLLEAFYWGGSIPEQTYLGFVHALNKDVELDKYVNVFLPTSNIAKDGHIKDFSEPLLVRALKEKECFAETYVLLSRAHAELFPTFASVFVSGYLPKYVSDTARNDIEIVLSKLLSLLRARHQSVEKGKFDVVAIIDKHCQEVFNTLKLYGIHATTYDEARLAYERLFIKPPPKDIQEEVRARIRQLTRSKVALQADCEEEVKLNPQWETFIRWEYQTEIEKLTPGDA